MAFEAGSPAANYDDSGVACVIELQENAWDGVDTDIATHGITLNDAVAIMEQNATRTDRK